MTDQPDISKVKPWTVKEISASVAAEIVAEARRTDTTAGQLVERMWAAWKANGSPVALPSPEPAPSDVVGDLRRLLEFAGPFGAENPMPGRLRSLINGLAGEVAARRSARGTPRGRTVNGAKRIGSE